METGFRVPLRRGDDSRCLGRPRLVPHLRLPPLLRAGCLSAHLAFSRADNVQAINGRVVLRRRRVHHRRVWRILRIDDDTT